MPRYEGREAGIWDYCSRKFRADDNAPFTAPQQETFADGDIAREARDVAHRLSNSRIYNDPASVALRSTYRGREEEYLYARFADALGWRTHKDARKFYNKHSGGFWGSR